MSKVRAKADAHPSRRLDFQGLQGHRGTPASQAEGRGFESRFPLQIYQGFSNGRSLLISLLCKWLANASAATHKAIRQARRRPLLHPR
jgi:hypothetical protein